MARITVIACIAAATAISPARSEKAVAASGPSKDVVTRWFRGAGGPVCTNAAGCDTACDPGRVLALRTYHNASGGMP